MDPITIATGILAFATLISNITILGQSLAKVPDHLLELQRDVKDKVTVLSHTTSLVRMYRPTERFRDLDIGRELTDCCHAVRKAVMKLLDDLQDATGPPDHRLGVWRKRLQGIRDIPNLKEADKEIRQHMEWFDRLRDSFLL